MNVLKTNLQDVRIVETDVFGDHRGFFTETYTKNKFIAAGDAVTISTICTN